jgi:hypothetical protein
MLGPGVNKERERSGNDRVFMSYAKWKGDRKQVWSIDSLYIYPRGSEFPSWKRARVKVGPKNQ